MIIFLRSEQCSLAVLWMCVLLVYLQRLEEAEGAQPSAAGHQTESGIVEHLLVVVPAGTHTHRRVVSSLM